MREILCEQYLSVVKDAHFSVPVKHLPARLAARSRIHMELEYFSPLTEYKCIPLIIMVHLLNQYDSKLHFHPTPTL